MMCWTTSRNGSRTAATPGPVRAAWAAGVAVAIGLVPQVVSARSLTDYFGPREVAVGEALRADARGDLAITMNPSGLALGRQLVFEGAFAYRPGDSMASAGVSACDSTVPVAGCFYYHYFNASPEIGGEERSRRAHDFGVAAARAVTQSVYVGVNSRYFDYESNVVGEEDASGFAADVGITVLATQWLQIGAVGYNVIAKDSSQYPLAFGGGITARPMPQLAIGLDGMWDLDVPDDARTGRYGVGAEYFFQSADQQTGYPIRIGAVHDRTADGTYLSGGLGFTSVRVGIDLAARKQVSGGDELVIVGGLRLFGPTMP